MTNWRPISEFRIEQLGDYDTLMVACEAGDAALEAEAHADSSLVQTADGLKSMDVVRFYSDGDELSPIAFTIVHAFDPAGEAHEPGHDNQYEQPVAA